VAGSSGIPRFDPVQKNGPVHHAIAALARTQLMRSFTINVVARIDPFVMKLSRGYIGLGGTLPSANLTTTGARSGQRRTVTVLYFSDGDDVILVASSFGRDKHPAWYHNLKAHPTAHLERGGRSGDYVATEVEDDAERARLFAKADQVYAGYADYRDRTAAVGRRIPILRLSLAA
jgi:deazaflavin-dependent oxidoreductase (nitroreductase family)